MDKQEQIQGIIKDTEWRRKQLFPRWRKTSSNTWVTNSFGYDLEVYWERRGTGCTYTVAGKEHNASLLGKVSLYDLKTRAVRLASATYKKENHE